MSFDEILNRYKTKTCVLSIERIDETRYGNIRVMAGNQAHCDEILAVTGHPFEPGCPYEMCFPKDMNFEDFVFRSAIGGEPMHTYVSLYQMGLWLNIFMIPLTSEEKNIGYCIYSYEVTPQASTEKMSDVSADSSARVLETCIKFRGTTNFEHTVEEVIGDIRDICDSEECCILLLDEDAKKCRVLAEARRDGAKHSASDFIDDNFYSMALNWEKTLQGSTCLIIDTDQEMEELRRRDPVWYESLIRDGIQSLVLFPLKRAEQTLGYIWALNFNIDNAVKIKETLELTTFFVASEIANHLLMERLRILSSVDMLTGIKNRNIMNNRIDRVIAGKDSLQEPFAVIFADLNGLKKLNDTEGHHVGDAMIKEAAAILSEVFPDAEVYRAGGDEFMVIACNMEPEIVESRIRELIDKSNATKTVRFAVGVSLSKDEPDILKAMRTADQRMYEDKDRFYEAHPELQLH
ncbi:MAG: sensor domain-containing diguanylate cyclase [Clostridiales bacterium]|nr:sensor domain-containing diguanylate cyclase [Clostridiales bacterium]